MSTSTRSTAQIVAIVFGLFAIACGGDFCQDATSTVVEQTVKGSKQVTKGIVEGVKEGRKAGESVDGAAIVTTMEELDEAGSIVVHAITPVGANAQIQFAVENTTDAPLRLSGMTFTVLDADGFDTKLTKTDNARTVAPKAKDKVTIEVPIAPDRVGTIRLWGQDLEIPADARKAPEAPAQDAGAAE